MIVREEGDSALLISWPELKDPLSREPSPVLALHRWITERNPAGLREAVPGLASLLLVFDPLCTGPGELRSLLEVSAARPAPLPSGRTVEVPVKYGGAEGPDLESVARRSGRSPEEVIRLHAKAEYRVAFLGFSPGFPYLTGLPEALATPRLASPRPRVPAGSVGIAGSLSGIYPRESPGGWNLIGRTSEQLCDFTSVEPFLLGPGDEVVFRPVTSLAPLPEAVAPRQERGMPAVRLLEPGLLTTVQDRGRPGHAHQGVPPSGPLDPLAFRLANLAAGNVEGAPALEFTFPAPRLRFLERVGIALGGADFGARLGGRPAPLQERMEARQGDELTFTGVRSGSWAYLALAGGISWGRVLGSAAADLRSAIFGRLPPGAALAIGAAPPAAGRVIPRGLAPLPADGAVVRFLPGEEACSPPLDDQSAVLSPVRDRSGYRTLSPALPATDASLFSEGIAPGAIQLPPDGRLIFLLADRPTTGGYRKLAFFASVDQRVIAQSPPRGRLSFRRVTAGEARRLLAVEEAMLASIRGS